MARKSKETYCGWAFFHNNGDWVVVRRQKNGELKCQAALEKGGCWLLEKCQQDGARMSDDRLVLNQDQDSK